MISSVYSACLWGIDSLPVEIEVDVSSGLPQMILVGLPDQAVKEAKERIRAAIKNSSFPLPSKKIVINLAPADVKKEGPSFDLAMAIGILACLGHVRPEKIGNVTFLGELALDGSIRKTKGVLPAALGLKDSTRCLVIPEDNGAEGALVSEVPVFTASSLNDVVRHLNGEQALPRAFPAQTPAEDPPYPFDFQEVKGQWQAKRALEIAVAGAHNVILVGPAGSGKSMLARRIPGILPRLARDEMLEISKIYSAAGFLNHEHPVAVRRPFRAPHHTISPAGLIGGGSFPRPGEITLAHHGVLFLDEIAEFRRDTLETLRTPLEEHAVWIGRAKASVKFPARFMLVAAMNPCKCGLLGSPGKSCRCSLGQILEYRSKISGPLLDRIDLHIDVPAVKSSLLTAAAAEGGENSRAIRERIESARARQRERFKNDAVRTNSEMSDRDLKRCCAVSPAGKKLLESAINDLGLSARAYSRILKVSRTIADLEPSETLREEHLAEAIQYRSLDRQLP